MFALRVNTLVFAYVFFLLFLSASSYAIPVIPEESGFGMDTPAGRGGEIYIVENLDSSGEGSLRECIEASRPRVCLFEVSGTIFLEEELEIKDPYITIAGQSAPSPGITIAGAGVSLESHDILIQHLRVRVGDREEGPNPQERDSISIGSDSGEVYNIVVDHVSASWAIDEVLSIWSYSGSIYNVTISNSIISEGLYDSIHPQGTHSTGVLVGKNSRDILLKKNLFAYNYARNPLVRDDTTDIVILNNLLFDSGTPSENKIAFGSRGENDMDLRASVVGNVHINKTNDNHLNTIFIDENSPTGVSIFLDDNKGPLLKDDQWDIVKGRDDISVRAYTMPIWADGIKVESSEDVLEQVLAKSGARPIDRDNVDKRVVDGVGSREGGFVDSQDEVGGWPELEENRRELHLPENPNLDHDGDGYTNLEEWLHLYLYNVEIEKNESLDVKKRTKSEIDVSNDSGCITEKNISDNACISEKQDSRPYYIPAVFVISMFVIFALIMVLIIKSRE